MPRECNFLRHMEQKEKKEKKKQIAEVITTYRDDERFPIVARKRVLRSNGILRLIRG